jgi:hypothetical protein
MLQQPLEKQVTSLRELRSRHDFIQMHLQEPDFFGWVSQETLLVKVLAPTFLFYEEATSKSSTIKGLLYAYEPEKFKKGSLSDRPQLSGVTSMALLCHW